MTAFFAILIVGLGTYASRSVFILALADREIPPRVTRALEYVGPAVLGSLVIALLIDGEGNVAIGVPEGSAFFAAALVAWKTSNLIYTLMAGMAAYWLLGVWF
jgi:branched-subunit amino acid transport protein